MFPINRQSHQHIDEVVRVAAVAVQVVAEAADQDPVRHVPAAMAVVVHDHTRGDRTRVQGLDLVHSAVPIIVDVGEAQIIVRAATITASANSIDQIISEISKIVVEIAGIVAAMDGATVAAVVATVISVTTVVNVGSIVDRLHTAQSGDAAMIVIVIVALRLRCRQMRIHHRHQRKIHSQDPPNRALKKSNGCWRKPRKKNKKK